MLKSMLEVTLPKLKRKGGIWKVEFVNKYNLEKDNEKHIDFTCPNYESDKKQSACLPKWVIPIF